MDFAKKKSWSIKLVPGHILNGKVKGEQCTDCNYASRLIAENKGNPELLLFSCDGPKCKNLLIRLNLNSAESLVLPAEKPFENFELAQPNPPPTEV